jgi:mRNA-degrading endonuclease RelE of RelBE toxin-antitoxin system
MTWACEIADAAKRDLRNLPKAIQNRVARVIDEMTTDPFRGDVKGLKGDEWRGVFRRRVGDYRILFLPDQKARIVHILRIVIRSGGTYR